MTMIRGLSTLIAVAMILSTALSQSNCCQFQIGNNINGEAAGDFSGVTSLSADGKTVGIAGRFNGGNGYRSGHVRIFAFDSTSRQWIQKGSDIEGEVIMDLSGSSLSLSSDGNTIAIGAPSNNDAGQDAGHVRIYGYDSLSMTWAQKGSDIDGETAGDQSGTSVSLSSDGNTIAIGAPFNSDAGQGAGHVRLYFYDPQSMAWIQKGNDIDGEASVDQSGTAVSLSLDGNTIAIGSPFHSKNNFDSLEIGEVRIFSFDSLSQDWVQSGNDLYGKSHDRSGGFISLSANGKTIAVGATGIFGSDSYTRIYSWDYQSMSWIQKGGDIDALNYLDTQRDINLSVDGHTIVIGSNGGSNLTGGLVRTFFYNSQSNTWVQKSNDIENLGANVSLSFDGKIIAIGSTRSYNQSGSVRLFNTIDLNAITSIPPNIKDSFVGLDGTYSGGSISSANNACPSGSTLHYAIDDGDYSKEVPIYNQTIAQKIETTCICDLDENVKSQSSSVMTTPGSSPTSVIPTLGEWGVSMLALLLIILGVVSYHQRIEWVKV